MRYGILNWWWGENNIQDEIRKQWITWMRGLFWQNEAIELKKLSDDDYYNIEDAEAKWNPEDGKYLVVADSENNVPVHRNVSPGDRWFTFERRFRFSVKGDSALFLTPYPHIPKSERNKKQHLFENSTVWEDTLLELEWSRSDIYTRRFAFEYLKELYPETAYGDIFAYSSDNEGLFLSLLNWDNPMNKFFYTVVGEGIDPLQDEKGARKLWVEFVRNNFVCVLDSRPSQPVIQALSDHYDIDLLEFWPDLGDTIQYQQVAMADESVVVNKGEEIELFDLDEALSLDNIIALHPRLIECIIRSLYIDGDTSEKEKLDWFLKDITESGSANASNYLTPFTQFLVNLKLEGKI